MLNKDEMNAVELSNEAAEKVAGGMGLDELQAFWNSLTDAQKDEIRNCGSVSELSVIASRYGLSLSSYELNMIFNYRHILP